jgi:hypothetical protein
MYLNQAQFEVDKKSTSQRIWRSIILLVLSALSIALLVYMFTKKDFSVFSIVITCLSIICLLYCFIYYFFIDARKMKSLFKNKNQILKDFAYERNLPIIFDNKNFGIICKGQFIITNDNNKLNEFANKHNLKITNLDEVKNKKELFSRLIEWY